VSNRWSVRTDGTPYVAFAQNDISGMTPGNLFQGTGLEQMYLEFAVHSLPIAFASQEEAHPLFTMREHNGATILGLFITPSGRIVGISPNGSGPASAVNIIRGDGLWHSATVTHDLFTGVTSLAYDGNAPAGTVTVAAPAAPSILGRFTLFNGASGLTRSAVSIRLASATGGAQLGAEQTATWAISEGEGAAMSADLDTFGGGGPIDLGLVAQFISPLSLPWGDPGTDPTSNYYWKLQTQWQRQARTPTVWSRSKVTWPS